MKFINFCYITAVVLAFFAMLSFATSLLLGGNVAWAYTFVVCWVSMALVAGIGLFVDYTDYKKNKHEL